jgi:hypothetical protein
MAVAVVGSENKVALTTGDVSMNERIYIHWTCSSLFLLNIVNRQLRMREVQQILHRLFFCSNKFLL